MKEVDLINTEILTEEEIRVTNSLIGEYSPKIKRLVKMPISLKIHFKGYEKNAQKKKYSLHAEIIFAGKTLNAEAWDYDLSRAIHRVMEKIETEVEHKFHSSEQHPK